MFANVRLMFVAISASLLAVVCAMALFMGVFAMFSVAHEPFSTLAAAKPPLQIAQADDFSVAVADGRPAPFGVRFRLNAPQAANRPVIVAVPQAVDRPAPPDAAPVAEPAANAAANAQPAPPPDDAQPSPQSSAATETEKTSERANDKTGDAKPDTVASNAITAANTTAANGGAAIIKTEPESPTSDRASATAKAPHRPAPPIRIVSHESDNPASVTTSPAPTPDRNKVMKRRKLAAHLRQSHHFRRPRIHQIATGQTQGGYATGIVQPNAYQAPSYATGTFGQSSGFTQQGFGYTPTAIKPRATRLRHAATKPATSQ